MKVNENDSEEDPENVAKSAENLLPLIQSYVKKGRIIYSDKWKAYCRLSTMGYRHHRINHSERFVDGHVHTQNIERLWRDMKEWIKKPGMKRSHLKYYLGRYLFCTKEVQKGKLLHQFLIETAKIYKPHGERVRMVPTDFLEPADLYEENYEEVPDVM